MAILTRQEALESLLWNPQYAFDALSDEELIALARKGCQRARELHHKHGGMDYNDPHWDWLDKE